jgi:hypothetical protein
VKERSLLFVCNVRLILSGRWMIEDETTYMKLRQVELGKIATTNKGGMLRKCEGLELNDQPLNL